MIRALIFDFDGLILETEGPIYQSWQDLYQRYSCEMALEDWQQNIGTAEETFDPIADLERRSGLRFNRDVDLPWRVRRELELIDAQGPRPGVTDVLRRGRELGLKIGLASSSTCDWVTRHLDRLGLRGYFDVLTARDDVTNTKPDPELYLTAAEWLGVAPEESLAFEDSLHGLMAAKNAGMHCVVVPTEMTANLSLDAADLRLASLDKMTLDEILRYLTGS